MLNKLLVVVIFFAAHLPAETLRVRFVLPQDSKCEFLLTPGEEARHYRMEISGIPGVQATIRRMKEISTDFPAGRLGRAHFLNPEGAKDFGLFQGHLLLEELKFNNPADQELLDHANEFLDGQRRGAILVLEYHIVMAKDRDSLQGQRITLIVPEDGGKRGILAAFKVSSPTHDYLQNRNFGQAFLFLGVADLEGFNSNHFQKLDTTPEERRASFVMPPSGQRATVVQDD